LVGKVGAPPRQILDDIIGNDDEVDGCLVNVQFLVVELVHAVLLAKTVPVPLGHGHGHGHDRGTGDGPRDRQALRKGARHLGAPKLDANDRVSGA
jgi:hypothetical protein